MLPTTLEIFYAPNGNSGVRYKGWNTSFGYQLSAQLTGTEPDICTSIFTEKTLPQAFKRGNEVVELQFQTPWSEVLNSARNGGELRDEISLRVAAVNAKFDHGAQVRGLSFSFDKDGKITGYIYDGAPYSLIGWRLSRVLTETEWEDGYGVFSEKFAEVMFQRGDQEVRVDFDQPFSIDLAEQSTQQILEEIWRRVDLVVAAFGSTGLTLKSATSKTGWVAKLDGESHALNHHLSRKLTSTTDEEGYGIFSDNNDGPTLFLRGNIAVAINWDETFSDAIEGLSKAGALAVIRSRVKDVEQAFANRPASIAITAVKVGERFRLELDGKPLSYIGVSYLLTGTQSLFAHQVARETVSDGVSYTVTFPTVLPDLLTLPTAEAVHAAIAERVSLLAEARKMALSSKTVSYSLYTE